MASGQKPGDKIFQGDKRTPEGVYRFTEFLNTEDLRGRHGKQGQIYGVGAFVMDYPNPFDRLNKKTGSGIWLHATDDEARINKGLDSRGCLVTANQDLIDISRFLELGKTSVVVVQDLTFLQRHTFLKKREKLKETVFRWLGAWQNKNLEEYLANYDKRDFRDPIKGDFAGFRAHKRQVFSYPGKPEIRIENLSILRSDEYAVATFKQFYQAGNLNGDGYKSLYLKRNDYYDWKIIAERWSKADLTAPNLEASPSLALNQSVFFKNPEKELQEFMSLIANSTTNDSTKDEKKGTGETMAKAAESGETSPKQKN